jgi:uncharacterized protein
MGGTYQRTERTTALRHRERVDYDRDAVHSVLDEALTCHLAFVADGQPRLLPTLHVRVDNTVYVHGSTGSHPMLAARSPDGLPVCLAVTVLDGLVLARSHFHHSVNYRSVIAHGVAALVCDDPDKRTVLDALLDKLGSGRAADSRPPTSAELAQTAVLALPLQEVSVKIRSGPVADDPADADLPHWAGVVPVRQTRGVPQPAAGVRVPVPPYLATRDS